MRTIPKITGRSIHKDIYGHYFAGVSIKKKNLCRDCWKKDSHGSKFPPEVDAVFTDEPGDIDQEVVLCDRCGEPISIY